MQMKGGGSRARALRSKKGNDLMASLAFAWFMDNSSLIIEKKVQMQESR